MKGESSSLRDRVLNLFSSTRGSLTQKHFEKEFSDVSLTNILPILNALQKEGMLDVLVSADRTLSWQLRDQSSVDKLKNLSDLEERLVYNAIRKAGEDAASIKAISVETKLPQNRIPRILKSLITKKMIKELPMAIGHKQKVYLLIELEPSEKLAANTLFAGESGVDAEFIAMLRAACLKYLQDKTAAASHIADPLDRRNSSYVSVEEIHRFIINTKICTVSMTLQDVKCVLEALKFGGELETRLSSEATSIDATDSTVSAGGVLYRLASLTPCTASLAHMPCSVCLCRKDCRLGGSISPENCKLFQAFLEF